MERDNQRNVQFQVVQEDVAAALVIDDVTRPAQTWTSISLIMALGVDLIWLTFSRPSR